MQYTEKQTSERQTGDTGAGERHHCIYSQSRRCVYSWTANKACCAGHLVQKSNEKLDEYQNAYWTRKETGKKDCVYVCESTLTKGLLGVKIVLIGVLPPPLLPLLGGLILFSFCRRLQNQTRITSFSMLSWSAIIAISSEVGFWFCLKRAKKPEMPCEHCGDFNIFSTRKSAAPLVCVYSV